MNTKSNDDGLPGIHLKLNANITTSKQAYAFWENVLGSLIEKDILKMEVTFQFKTKIPKTFLDYCTFRQRLEINKFTTTERIQVQLNIQKSSFKGVKIERPEINLLVGANEKANYLKKHPVDDKGGAIPNWSAWDGKSMKELIKINPIDLIEIILYIKEGVEV